VQGNSGNEEEFIESISSNNGQAVHGHQVFSGYGAYEFIVPSGVRQIEISILGSTGGNGGTACNTTCGVSYSGGVGGSSATARVILPVEFYDTVSWSIGENGAAGIPCFTNYVCGGTSGQQGSVSHLYLNNALILSLTGGTGGGGGYKGNNFPDSAYGEPGVPGEVVLSDFSLNNGIIVLNGNVWDIGSQTVLIRY
jgi:hypothetical protein